MTTMVQETKPALAKGGSDVERTRMETWLRDRVERSQKECLTNEKAEIIFRAWNAVQNGEKPVRLVALNGALPKLVR